MFPAFYESLAQLMSRGGGVMWLLLALSIVAVALVLERAWFWLANNPPHRTAAVERLSRSLRDGEHALARQMAQSDSSVYGRLALRLLDEPGSEAAMADAIESQRRRIERFMPTLSTVITAAPMLGILGTVLGLIDALSVLAGDEAVTDPRLISPAIAQALLTTAAGMFITIVVLFPYNAFRAQIDRTLSRIETLAAAAEQGRKINQAKTPVTPAPTRTKTE